MSENLGSTIKDFKYSVIKPIKFYNRIKDMKQYSNISFSQFKTRNISFDIFEAAFLDVSNENLISDAQLANIFKYLTINIKGSSDASIKRTVMKIERVRIALVTKLCTLDKEKDKIAIENIDNILIELRILKNIIIDSLKNKNKEIENEIQFDMLMEDIIYPEEFNSSTLLSTLFYNLPILGNSVLNGKRFNEKLYRALLTSIHENDAQMKKYYIELANIVKQANIFTLDRRVSNICGFNKYDNVTRTKLSEKISKLEYDTNRGRYRLNDFIVTIDNESTSNFDDALSIEKTSEGTYILGIHIADVYSLGLLPKNKETIEFKSKASLRECTEKNAISLFVEISNTGLIIDKKVLMTNIEVNNNLLYDDVSKILVNTKNEKINQTIIDLIGLYNIVDNTKLPDFPGPSSMAHALVQKYMLLYGCVVSDIASKCRCPILYQMDNSKTSDVSISKVNIDTGFDEMNNLSTYARFTSPIWDLRSFINQTSICKCIFDRIDINERNSLRLELSSLKNKINKSNKHLQE